LERMVTILLEKETVGTDEVAQIFSDVPKWEHDPDGSLRIRPPSQPPVSEPGVAAAVPVEEAVSEGKAPSRKPRVLPRLKPADAPGS
jgi:cell division protease FtsH